MLIYDGDCGSCTATARWLESRLRTPVLVVPGRDIDDLAELGLTVDDVAAALHWIDVYGRVWRGADAVARVLRLCRGPAPVAGAVLGAPPVSWVAGPLYRVTGRHHRSAGAPAPT